MVVCCMYNLYVLLSCIFTEYLLLYICQTEGGSSGGPIMKATHGRLEIVGLHRGGCYYGYNFGSKFKAILDNVLEGKIHDK